MPLPPILSAARALDSNLLTGCANCVSSPTFDLHVDVTAALRAGKIHPKRAVLEVMVESADDSVAPLADTPVPTPSLKGPRLGSGVDLAEGKDDNDAADGEELTKLLGDMTDGTIKAFQKAVGLAEDGVVGPMTRAMLAVQGLAVPSKVPEGVKLELNDSKTVTWSLETESVPASLAPGVAAGEGKCLTLAAEMQAAFDAWSEPTGIRFVQVVGEAGQVVVEFDDRTSSNDFIFDGPGGALACAAPGSITFDSTEKWELQSVPHPHRKAEAAGARGDFWANASIFSFQVVALHEVGHIIGLGHTTDPADVMSPYYIKGQLSLSENDKARARALYESE